MTPHRVTGRTPIGVAWHVAHRFPRVTLSAPDYSDVGEVVRQMGFALLLHMGHGHCAIPGAVPDWWSTFAGGGQPEFAIDDDQPFLLNFLIDAEAFWQARRPGSLSSGIWENDAGDQGTLLLEAHAVCCGDDSLLLIEEIHSHQSNPTHVIRASRQLQLELLRDIALRKQIEIELRNARDAALQLEQVKTRLLANASHELRTPIASVMGMLEMALASEANRTAHIQSAYQAACRLARTLSELLDYAACEARQPPLQTEHFSMSQVIRELASGFALAAAEKGLRLELDIPHDQEVFLHSDRTRLQQIVSNLLDNAIRYTHRGFVKLSVTNGAADFCEITVGDTGPGIPADEQRLIFQPFERGSSSHRADGGKGLGLAIVQDLVRALGGEVLLKSELEQGSNFRVRLPWDAGEQPGIRQRTAETSQWEPPAEPAAAVIPAGLRILVAEDNQINRAYLAHVLRSANCHVDEVDNGVDLMRLAATQDYDAVFTDCRMPDVSGLNAVRQIRQAERVGGCRLPIIAITADSSEVSRQQFIEAGIDDILRKPVMRNEMLNKLAECLRPRDASGG